MISFSCWIFFRFLRSFYSFGLFRLIFEASRLLQILRIFSDTFKDTVRNPQDSFKFFSSTQIISDPYRSFQIPADSSKFYQFFEILLEFSKFLEIPQNSLRFSQVPSNFFQFFSNVPISFRFPQILSDSLIFL